MNTCTDMTHSPSGVHNGSCCTPRTNFVPADERTVWSSTSNSGQRLAVVLIRAY